MIRAWAGVIALAVLRGAVDIPAATPTMQSATSRYTGSPIKDEHDDAFFWSSLVDLSVASEAVLRYDMSRGLHGRYIYRAIPSPVVAVPARTRDGQLATYDKKTEATLPKLPSVTSYYRRAEPGSKRTNRLWAVIVDAQYVWLKGYSDNCETVEYLSSSLESKGWVRRPYYPMVSGPVTGNPEGLIDLPNRIILSLPRLNREAVIISRSEAFIQDCVVEADFYLFDSPTRAVLEQR